MDCIRCGECCRKQTCGMSMAFLNTSDNCAALEKQGDTYACGLMLHAHKYVAVFKESDDEIVGVIIRKILGVGDGCGLCPEQKFIGAKMKRLREDILCQRKQRKQ